MHQRYPSSGTFFFSLEMVRARSWIDGQLRASASSNATVRLRNVKTGRAIGTLRAEGTIREQHLSCQLHVEEHCVT
jgi:hypothetical protein